MFAYGWGLKRESTQDKCLSIQFRVDLKCGAYRLEQHIILSSHREYKSKG
jgi:hypothetical protein